MDWNKIRKDYIARKGSYRELSAKYGISYKQIAKRAKAENWVELRNQAEIKRASNIADAVAEANGKVDTTLQDAAAVLIGKVAEGIQAANPENAKALKSYSGVLKDLKEVLDLRAPLDIKEQEARIAKLRAEADRGKDEGGKEIAVTLGGAEEWAK